MILPDPKESRAVLVGVSGYTKMPGLPAVKNNVEALKYALTGAASWNLPFENCTVVHDPATPEELVDPILEAADQATDTLLFYYAGHGIKGPNRGELRLTRTTSRPGAPHTATHYDDIRDILLDSSASRRVVILDCCYAASALGTMSDPGGEIAEDALTAGTYLIAAAGETETAMSDGPHGFTVFTGELINLLRSGISSQDSMLLDLDTIFRELDRSLRAKSRPRPRRRVRDSPGNLALSWNRGWLERQHGLAEEHHRTTLEPQDNPLLDASNLASTSGVTLGQLRPPEGLTAIPSFETHAGGWPDKAGAANADTEGAKHSSPSHKSSPGVWPRLPTRPDREHISLTPEVTLESKNLHPEAKVSDSPSGSIPDEASTELADTTTPSSTKSSVWPPVAKVPNSGQQRVQPKPSPRPPQPGSWPTIPITPNTSGVTGDSPPPSRISRNPEEDEALNIQRLWPEILTQVKNRRRFAWILLSQNVQSIEYANETLHLRFQNIGSHDNYVNADVDALLKRTLLEDFNLSCEIAISIGDKKQKSYNRPDRDQIEKITVGDEVTHEQFGKGEIISMTGDWPATEAIVNFGNYGEKRLLMRYAPIAKGTS